MSDFVAECLKNIPSDWDIKSIYQLSSRVGSGITPTGGSEVYKDEGIVFLRSQNIKFEGLDLSDVAFVDERQHGLMKNSEVFAFDVLVNITGASIGRCCFVPVGIGKANQNQHVCTIRLLKPNEKDAKFLSSVLASPIGQRQIFKLNAGGNREGLNYQQLGSFKLPWPIKRTRSKIAEILTTIDKTIEKTQLLIHKYQQIKAGLTYDLFTRGLTTDGKLRPPREQAPALYQETPIGWIPKTWEVDFIGNVFHIQLGKMLSKAAKTGKWNASYLGNKNVQWDRVDLTDLETMDFNPTEREKFSLLFGDLLVCEGGDVGRTSMWQEEIRECFYQKAIHRLRPSNESVKPSFMLRFMRFAKQTNVFSDFTSQSSIAHLTQEKLAKVKMFIPSLSEQTLMIERFDSVDKLINEESAFLEKLKVQKSGLMHDLLTGKVQVSIHSEETIHGS